MSVDPRLTITGIQKLQRANAKMINALKPSGARGRAVQYGLTEGHKQALIETHTDTGALKASHRMQYGSGGAMGPTGTIYIDRTTRNPKTNAMPYIYGVYEHARADSGSGGHDFYARVVRLHGKRIIAGMIKVLVGDFPKGG